MADHYIECIDIECLGCLPNDEQVAALSVGLAKQEARRRGLRCSGAVSRQAILDDADDYRARSAEARDALL